MNYDEYKHFETSLNYRKDNDDKRPHIGLVLLSTDHSLEADCVKILEDKALIFTTRVKFDGDMSPDNLKNIENNISSSAQLVATGLDMDVMAFACTSASIMIGNDKIDKLLNTRRNNVSTTNPFQAAIKAFNHLDLHNIAVLTPYTSDINYKLYHEITSEGYNIPVLGGFGIERDFDISKVSKESIFNSIETILSNRKDIDALFISCTNFRTSDFIVELEQKYDIPVITSNTALLWHALCLSKKHIEISDYGRLFQSGFNY